MSNLTIFKNEDFGDIRTTLVDNQPYFCLADVCRILDIKNVSDCKDRLKKDGVVNNDVIDSLGRRQVANFINESNLYKCIFQSRQPYAEKFQDWGLQQPNLTKLIITKDMRERKATMEKHADAFIAMPGGFGTFEEIFEILVAKQLGYHDKPVIFVNFDGYYDNMIKMFDTLYENNFAKEEMKSLYFIAKTVDEIFEYVETYAPKEFVHKW